MAILRDGESPVPCLTAAEPWLSAEAQLPVCLWDEVFMGFAMMLVEGFCCSVVVF